MLQDEILDGLEQLVYLGEIDLSPVLLVDVFVDVVILAKFIAF